MRRTLIFSIVTIFSILFSIDAYSQFGIKGGIGIPTDDFSESGAEIGYLFGVKYENNFTESENISWVGDITVYHNALDEVQFAGTGLNVTAYPTTFNLAISAGPKFKIPLKNIALVGIPAINANFLKVTKLETTDGNATFNTEASFGSYLKAGIEVDEYGGYIRWNLFGEHDMTISDAQGNSVDGTMSVSILSFVFSVEL